MARDHVGFKAAAQSLRSWVKAPSISVHSGREGARLLRDQQRRAERIKLAAMNLEGAERAMRLDVRTHLISTETRIASLVAAPKNDDRWWSELAFEHELHQQLVATYGILSFANIRLRTDFLLGDRAVRQRLISESLLSGYVRAENSTRVYLDFDPPGVVSHELGVEGEAFE